MKLIAALKIQEMLPLVVAICWGSHSSNGWNKFLSSEKWKDTPESMMITFEKYSFSFSVEKVCMISSNVVGVVRVLTNIMSPVWTIPT
eukprot:snap_masked-scaffold_112-processed-gene-0.3-mRNA-1 protein AED:1.00 eAED:1.00 QI:0/0/0/0/1/1/2/0/87